MQKYKRYAYAASFLVALALALGLWKPVGPAKASSHGIPHFRVDPFWPKPMPVTVTSGVAHTWVLGEVAGSCVDAHDNVYTFNRGWETGITPPGGTTAQGSESGAIVGQDASASSIPSPPVVAFDPDGNVVVAFGNPALIPYPQPNYGAAAYMPHGAHGCYVDYQGNIWVGGNGDGIVQKYPADGGGGVYTLQIGVKGQCDGAPAATPAAVFPTCNETNSTNSSHTLLNEPADIAVDPRVGPISHMTGDIYIADGYGNHRVVVFDRTGKYLTQFGTNCGQVSQSCPNGAFGATGGGHPHCVVLGNDDLVYACDRPNSRIQVFTKTGTFVKLLPINSFPGATADKRAAILLAGTRACDIDFYPNQDTLGGTGRASQKYIIDVDLGNDNTWILERASGTVIGALGRCGFAPCPGHNAGNFAFGHTTASDSRGNVYVAETITGRRIQKFVRSDDDDDHDDGGRGGDD